MKSSPSTKYAGFFTAHLDNGKTILLGPDMEEVVYPQSGSIRF